MKQLSPPEIFHVVAYREPISPTESYISAVCFEDNRSSGYGYTLEKAFNCAIDGIASSFPSPENNQAAHFHVATQEDFWLYESIKPTDAPTKIFTNENIHPSHPHRDSVPPFVIYSYDRTDLKYPRNVPREKIHQPFREFSKASLVPQAFGAPARVNYRYSYPRPPRHKKHGLAL